MTTTDRFYPFSTKKNVVYTAQQVERFPKPNMKLYLIEHVWSLSPSITMYYPSLTMLSMHPACPALTTTFEPGGAGVGSFRDAHGI